MSNDERTRLAAQIHLLTVELAYIEGTEFLCRKFTNNRKLFLEFEEMCVLIHRLEFPRDSYKAISLNKACNLWNEWRIAKEKNLSIPQLMNRLDPNNSKYSFISFVKENNFKVIIAEKGKDFYLNPSYSGASLKNLYEKISANKILKKYLLLPEHQY